MSTSRLAAAVIGILWVAGSLQTGCAPRAVGARPVAAWTVNVGVDSELQSVSGQALPVGLASLASVAEERQFRVSATPIGQHRDGSVTEHLRFDSDTDVLDGRVIAMRRFESGEILALDGLGHVAGASGGVDVLSLMFPVLSPKVPLLRRGAVATMETSWPIEVAEGRRVRERVRTEWSWVGRARVSGRRCVRLRYEGVWRTEGEDAGHSPAVPVEASGVVGGSVCLHVQDMTLVEHDFRWERVVTTSWPASNMGGRVSQRQAFSGRAERVEVSR